MTQLLKNLAILAVVGAIVVVIYKIVVVINT